MTARKDSPTQRTRIRDELQTILNWISTPEAVWEEAEAKSVPIRERPRALRVPDDIANYAIPDPSTAPGSPAEQRVYGAIRDAILEHRIAPGTKLKEVALAELFHVSRATIRNVLAHLGHGHLVELRLNRGAIVASPTAQESAEIFEARRAIEGAIITKAARTATEQDLAALRELVASEKAAYERADEREALRLSVEFHRKVALVARNGTLARYLEELLLRTPLIALTYHSLGPTACGPAEHLALVEAIATRDEGGAADLMSTHIERLEDDLVRVPPAPAKTLAEVFRERPARQIDDVN